MLEKLFKLSQKNTTVRTEIVAGLTTFLTMAYILGVNSTILGTDAGLGFSGVFFATAVSSAIACFLMGLLANYPVALAPGMGVNAFFAYTVVLGKGYTGSEALSLVLISGVIFLLISVMGIRQAVINAIPSHLKLGIGAAIGFFIAFIGLKNAGIIVANPATFVSIGNLKNPTVALAVFGIAVTLILLVKKIKAAVFYGLVITAVFGIVLGLAGISGMPALPAGVISFNPDTSLVGAAFTGFNTLFSKHAIVDIIIIIFTFLFVDFFDTTGTLVAVCSSIGIMNDKGELEDVEKALMADSIGTIAGAALGTSTVTSFVESTSGVSVGGRTGLTAVTTGLLFLLSVLFAPLISVVGSIPVGDAFLSPVTAPALIVVGILMVSHLGDVDFTDIEVSAPVFMTLIFMTLTYSIADGIAVGFVSYGIVSAASKKWKNFTPAMIVLLVVFVAHFLLK